MSAPMSPREQERLAALRDYAILDTPPELEFDDIAGLAAQICETPIALISLIDASRQWFKAKVGVSVAESAREHAFCAHAIHRPGENLVVPDATKDPRFATNPFVIGEPGVRFYAGSPLITPSGEALGTLCVIDRQPRVLRPEQLRALTVLSRHVMAQLQLRRQLIEQQRMETALRVIDADLLRAQAIAHVGSWIHDLAEGRLSWSDETYRIFGFEPGAIAASYADFVGLVHPEDRPVLALARAKMFETGEPLEAEHRILRPDGSVRWVEQRGEAVRDVAGRPVRIVGTTLDITARKEAELKLRASEERFELAVRGSTAAIWDWNRTTDECYYSPSYLELLGYGPDEFPPTLRSFLTHVHPDDLERVQGALEAHFSLERRPYQVEYRLRRQGGEYVWVSATGQAVYDAAGRAYRMVGGTVDISERRRADAKVREQAALIDESRDAIMVCDLAHTITFWSRGAERLYGWTAGEACGRTIETLLRVEPAGIAEANGQVQERGVWTGEMGRISKDLHVLTVDARWTLLRDERGVARSILLIDTDATERKLLEGQFLRAQRMESLGTLAGGIAHDLNNLLAPITMGVDLLKSLREGDAAEPILTVIERSARRGADLVKQVLSFARGVEGARVSVHLGHLLQELRSIAQNTFPKNVHLEFEVAPDIWLVSGDPTQLQQVLLNLCVNARDAMPAGGTIVLRAGNTILDAQDSAANRQVTPGPHVLVEVSDTGEGISPEIIDRIFEPFFTTKEVGHGTGLGLSTAIGIARSHGGFMNVTSELGNGATFKLYLPALNAAESLTPFDSEKAAQWMRGRGETVLVVDDEASIIEITRQTLQACGYRVLTAEDGAQAVGIYALHRHEIAVVFTDMMMPVMDGSALISALRRLDPEVRIVAVSGHTSTSNAARAVQEDVNHFLMKPFTAAAMLAVLREALADGAPKPGPA
jgi:two-component system cell cycle sensor histidine kinase/response regulator CckA